MLTPAANATLQVVEPPPFGHVACVALVVFIQASSAVVVVAALGFKKMAPHTSQSPAVNEMEVTSKFIVEVAATAEATNTVDSTICPTKPAPASLFVVVPTIPPVVGLNVMLVAVAAPRVGVVKLMLVAAMPEGSVLLILGTPVPEVISTPLLAVAKADITLAALA
jgi:hypothetical protein